MSTQLNPAQNLLFKGLQQCHRWDYSRNMWYIYENDNSLVWLGLLGWAEREVNETKAASIQSMSCLSLSAIWPASGTGHTASSR